jgi:hypothetical protein
VSACAVPEPVPTEPHGSDICDCGDYRSQHPNGGPCSICANGSSLGDGCTGFRFSHASKDRTHWNTFFGSSSAECKLPPDGWTCTREGGHDGPCAAIPSAPEAAAADLGDDYRPNPRSLSNSEVRATGLLCGGAVQAIARELLGRRTSAPEAAGMQVDTYVAPSQIHGLGCFASVPISKGGLVWRGNGFIPKHIYDFADNARYINDSFTPNTGLDADGNTVALRDIAAGEEITESYRETVPHLADQFGAAPIAPAAEELIANAIERARSLAVEYLAIPDAENGLNVCRTYVTAIRNALDRAEEYRKGAKNG